jgi:hypothetical protein
MEPTRVATFKTGQRVILLEDENCQVGEEKGYIVEGGENCDMFVVRVDKQYLQDKNDDGLREVDAAMIEKDGPEPADAVIDLVPRLSIGDKRTWWGEDVEVIGGPFIDEKEGVFYKVRRDSGYEQELNQETLL